MAGQPGCPPIFARFCTFLSRLAGFLDSLSYLFVAVRISWWPTFPTGPCEGRLLRRGAHHYRRPFDIYCRPLYHQHLPVSRRADYRCLLRPARAHDDPVPYAISRPEGQHCRGHRHSRRSSRADTDGFPALAGYLLQNLGLLGSGDNISYPHWIHRGGTTTDPHKKGY